MDGEKSEEVVEGQIIKDLFLNILFFKKITYFAPLGLRYSMWDCQSSQWYVGSFYFYVDLFTNLY